MVESLVALQLLLKEVDLTTLVQVLDLAICISYHTNTLEKGITQSILSVMDWAD